MYCLNSVRPLPYCCLGLSDSRTRVRVRLRWSSFRVNAQSFRRSLLPLCLERVPFAASMSDTASWALVGSAPNPKQPDLVCLQVLVQPPSPALAPSAFCFGVGLTRLGRSRASLSISPPRAS
ncbi:hypothetical protein C8R44DRAFT_819698 [Mycena epipterygia]|nr:hypothetical protein C8R44DRAFT_819698 [Mycena epipterygia]